MPPRFIETSDIGYDAVNSTLSLLHGGFGNFGEGLVDKIPELPALPAPDVRTTILLCSTILLSLMYELATRTLVIRMLRVYGHSHLKED